MGGWGVIPASTLMAITYKSVSGSAPAKNFLTPSSARLSLGPTRRSRPLGVTVWPAEARPSREGHRGTARALSICCRQRRLSLVAISACAQHRPARRQFAAIAGAVVAGPIGAVAGGVIGYTAGPRIVRDWRFHSRYGHCHGQTALTTSSGSALRRKTSRPLPRKCAHLEALLRAVSGHLIPAQGQARGQTWPERARAIRGERALADTKLIPLLLLASK